MERCENETAESFTGENALRMLTPSKAKKGELQRARKGFVHNITRL